MTNPNTRSATFTLRSDVAEEYAVGPAVLVRVDTRRSASGHVHAYAPVGISGSTIRDEQFWDTWGEVVELDA